jgi:drug/metabolite transporter (DMT)-like permease
VTARPAGRTWEVHLAVAGAQTGFALFPNFGKLVLVSIPPRTHASQVAFYVFLQPLISTALAIAVLDEVLTWKAVLAALLIGGGLATTVLGRPLPLRPLP